MSTLEFTKLSAPQLSADYGLAREQPARTDASSTLFGITHGRVGARLAARRSSRVQRRVEAALTKTGR